MDNTNWSNGYSSLINTNSNYEYLKFLEESGTDLGLESFQNSRKSKKNKSKSKSSAKKSSKSKSKKVSKSKSKKVSKSKSKKGSKSKSKKGSKSKSKKGSKSKSKKSKKSSKKIVTHTKGKKGKKYSHKFTKKKKHTPKVSPKVSPVVFPSISPGVFPSISPTTNYTPAQNNSGYISLPTLANPTTTTNPFSGVITVAQDYIGYRFDPRTKFGVTFNESLSNNYTYQGWEKLKNGRYIGRPLNSFSEIILLILEVNFGIPTADGEISRYNSKTGVYSYTST